VAALTTLDNEFTTGVKVLYDFATKQKDWNLYFQKPLSSDINFVGVFRFL